MRKYCTELLETNYSTTLLLLPDFRLYITQETKLAPDLHNILQQSDDYE